MIDAETLATVYTRDETAELLQVHADDAPESLTGLGMCEWLGSRPDAMVSAKSRLDQFGEQITTAWHGLPAGLFDSLRQRGWKRPTTALVHGELPADGYLGCMYESPVLGWGHVTFGKSVLSRYRVKPQSDRDLPARFIVSRFNARPEAMRAVRSATGGIHYAQDVPFPDKQLNSLPSLWCTQWAETMVPRWREALEPWADAGLDLRYIDVDWEFDAWRWHNCRRYGQAWLDYQPGDCRWPALCDEVGIADDELRGMLAWRPDDPRVLRWDAAMQERVVEYQRRFADAVHAYFPHCQVGSANAQHQVPSFYSVTRRPAWGTGAALDYQGTKFYREPDFANLLGCLAASRLPVRPWFQDNESNPWPFGDGLPFVREALEQPGIMPPVLSVEGGMPREATLEALAGVLLG